MIDWQRAATASSRNMSSFVAELEGRAPCFLLAAALPEPAADYARVGMNRPSKARG